jgi:hypothetical protein
MASRVLSDVVMSLAPEPASYDEVVILAQSSQETFDFPRIVLTVRIEFDGPSVTVDVCITEACSDGASTSEIERQPGNRNPRSSCRLRSCVARAVIDDQHVVAWYRGPQVGQDAAQQCCLVEGRHYDERPE